MKIKRGQGNYTLSQPIGLLISILVDDGAQEMQGFISAVQLVSFAEIAKRRVKEDEPLLGRPVMACIADDGNIYLWPAPDKDAELIVRAYGPVFEQ